MKFAYVISYSFSVANVRVYCAKDGGSRDVKIGEFHLYIQFLKWPTKALRIMSVKITLLHSSAFVGPLVNFTHLIDARNTEHIQLHAYLDKITGPFQTIMQ